MKSTLLCVLVTLATVCKAAELTYVDGYELEKKSVTFINGKKGNVVETITLKGKEVLFSVPGSGVEMVLDYLHTKIVVASSKKKGVCYIAELTDERQKQVPFKEIKEKLESQRGPEIDLEFPTGELKINARHYKVEDIIELGPLGQQLCKGAEKRVVKEKTAVSTVLRGKREVGFWEVVVIVVVIIVLL